MTEPQVWTLIAVFATIMVGTQTLLITGVRSQIGSLRTELKADIGGLRGEMNARFDALTSKVDHLDRDVQLLMNREFGENRG